MAGGEALVSVLCLITWIRWRCREASIWQAYRCEGSSPGYMASRSITLRRSSAGASPWPGTADACSQMAKPASTRVDSDWCC